MIIHYDYKFTGNVIIKSDNPEKNKFKTIIKKKTIYYNKAINYYFTRYNSLVFRLYKLPYSDFTSDLYELNYFMFQYRKGSIKRRQ